MMNHFESYLQIVGEQTPSVIDSLRPSIESFTENHISNFNCMSHITGLLYGQVQSGKTSQLLGAISAAADIGFNLFILLTTDNVRLQMQTLERAFETLDTFNICGEDDDLRFRSGRLRKPTLVILKKNQSVLRRWHDIIASSDFCRENPIFIVDDEADNASLNTRINQNEQSTINRLLESIKHLSTASIYLQVTATPQSMLLQRMDSDWSPDFTHYFEPGRGYLGGNFFYSEGSTSIRSTDDNERILLLRDDENLPEGLRRAFWSFLVAGSHLMAQQNTYVCNFLIHPGLRIDEHNVTERKIRLLLSNIRQDLIQNANTVFYELRDAWEDINTTKQGLVDFDYIRNNIETILNGLNIIVVNSDSDADRAFADGMNIVIGGNSLGRGLTLPRLHTVYYCRTAQTPQADTCWQHSRIFGYDRDPDLCRIFLPPTLLTLFRELDEANDALSGIIKEGRSIEIYSILSPRGTRPTRPSVIERGSYDIWYGGTNYFPNLPLSSNLKELDSLLGNVDAQRNVEMRFAKQVVGLIETESDEPWQKEIVLSHLLALESSGYDAGCALIIRVGRNISKGTGTLLSPDDRCLTQSYTDKLVLVVYRVNGGRNEGWEGSPLWIPNIKFPIGANYVYTTSD